MEAGTGSLLHRRCGSCEQIAALILREARGTLPHALAEAERPQV
jgi:bacterioferritin-associated ferredoxin